METVECSGQFNTSFFRILTILLLIGIIGILLFGFYTAKTQISSLEAQVLEKENQLKCYGCDLCKNHKGIAIVPGIGTIYTDFCTKTDCTKC